MRGIRYVDRPNSFPAPLMGLCVSEDAYIREMRRLKVDNYPAWVIGGDATTHIFDTEGGRVTTIICIRLREGVDYVQVAALIAHEVVHIWQEIRENINEKQPSPEFEAYTVQYILQKMLYALEEMRDEI